MRPLIVLLALASTMQTVHATATNGTSITMEEFLGCSEAESSGAVALGVLFPIFLITLSGAFFFHGMQLKDNITGLGRGLNLSEHIWFVTVLTSVALSVILLIPSVPGSNWSKSADFEVGPISLCVVGEEQCRLTRRYVNTGAGSMAAAAAFAIFAFLAAFALLALVIITHLHIVHPQHLVWGPALALAVNLCAFLSWAAWAAFNNDVLRVCLDQTHIDNLVYRSGFVFELLAWFQTLVLVPLMIAYHSIIADASKRMRNDVELQTSAVNVQNLQSDASSAQNIRTLDGVEVEVDENYDANADVDNDMEEEDDDDEYIRGDTDGLPPNWEAHVDDESGETYFYNVVTRETTWDRPE